MAKRKPSPADYETWEEWNQARSRAGMAPLSVKPVLFATALVVVIGVVAWVVLSRLGGTLDEEVLREGSAEITDDCYEQLAFRACPATVTWDDGQTEEVEVRATRDLQGTVPVEEHKTFESRRGAGGSASRHMQDVDIPWSAEHRPDGRPHLFPVIFGGVMVGAFVLWGCIIALGTKRLTARSRKQWARARGAASP